MGEPLPVDLIGALTNFLDSYTDRHEDVLVEAISNAIDAKAKKVHITLSKQPGRFYIKFANDGPGMNRNQFLSYHTISYSARGGRRDWICGSRCKDIFSFKRWFRNSYRN